MNEHPAISNQVRPAPAAPSQDVDVDQVANEIFSRLNEESTFESVQLLLVEGAERLCRSLGDPLSESIANALRELPRDQLELLIQEQNGLTCEQIAEREHIPQAEVRKKLTAARVHLRFALWPKDPA